MQNINIRVCAKLKTEFRKVQSYYLFPYTFFYTKVNSISFEKILPNFITEDVSIALINTVRKTFRPSANSIKKYDITYFSKPLKASPSTTDILFSYKVRISKVSRPRNALLWIAVTFEQIKHLNTYLIALSCLANIYRK